jgi:mono/diheme cytochrome c family protein
MNKTHDVEPTTVVIPEDRTSIERGAYLVASSCTGCHGDNLGGKVILDDPVIGFIPASNLTAGQGGIASTYGETDYVRAIRHGVSVEGKALMIMPSKAYWYFSDSDLGAIIAYLKTVEPVDNDLGSKTTGPIGRVLMQLGAFGEPFAAEVLDHKAPRPSSPEKSVTAEYGEYTINTGDCRNCHGPDLAGQQSPEPGSPFSPNLTPGGVLGIWSSEDFIDTIRTGTTPYGRELDPNFMPYKEYNKLTDDDLTAMFLYLNSLPALETNGK